MQKSPVAIDFLFETSWEVCNKIGGIYTVLSTKARTLQKLYKDKVIFIGPDVWSDDCKSPFFKEYPSILKEWKSKSALPHNIRVRTGRWDIPGRPLVILVKFDTMYELNDRFYGEMWEKFGVDSINSYGDYGEACAFSHAAGIVIESLYSFLKGKEPGDKKIIAHFNEWTTGMGLLYVKWKLPQVATIFTTHATSIGRSICGNQKPLYGQLHNYNGDQMAAELNMQAKHSLEKTAAHQADCFTTVSEVTAIECEQLLELRPHVVTPNGFEGDFVPKKKDYNTKRSEARTKLMSVTSALTGESYPDDTMLVATSGRCEYRNKGIDVFIDSINCLRNRKTDKKVIAYIMVPAWVKNSRVDLKEATEQGKKGRLNDPVITHELNNPWEDSILNRIHELDFTNTDPNITLIYVPCYLNGDDGIFNMAYYDLLIGMDATVFPSYYEPWGYTPLESIAFGVPTITTSLSGFGQWILTNTDNQFESCGVTVVGRGDYNYYEVVENISRSLLFLNEIDDEIKRKITDAAMNTASKAAWEYFIKYYIDAFEIALKRNSEENNLHKL